MKTIPVQKDYLHPMYAQGVLTTGTVLPASLLAGSVILVAQGFPYFLQLIFMPQNHSPFPH